MPGSRLWRLSRLPAQVGQRPQQATARVDHAGTRSSSPEVTRASSDGRAPHSNQWPKKGRGVAVITTLNAVQMVGGGAAICEPGCCTRGQGVAAEVDGRGGDLACRRASLTGTRAVSALNDCPGTSHRDEVRGGRLEAWMWHLSHLPVWGWCTRRTSSGLRNRLHGSVSVWRRLRAAPSPSL